MRPAAPARDPAAEQKSQLIRKRAQEIRRAREARAQQAVAPAGDSGELAKRGPQFEEDKRPVLQDIVQGVGHPVFPSSGKVVGKMPEPKTRKIAGYTITEWKIGGVIGLVGCMLLLLWIFATRETDQEKQARWIREDEKLAASKVSMAKSEALWNCKRMLKQAARDPQTAKIPDVPPLVGGADFRFLWNERTEMVRMRNGLGLEVATVALCVVDENTGRIKLLTLDGQRLIAPS